MQLFNASDIAHVLPAMPQLMLADLGALAQPGYVQNLLQVAQLLQLTL